MGRCAWSEGVGRVWVDGWSKGRGGVAGARGSERGGVGEGGLGEGLGVRRGG